MGPLTGLSGGMGLLTTAFAVAHRWLLLRGAHSRVAVGPAGAVHYYDVPGTGPRGTLVLQHGCGAEALHFLPVLRGLRRHFSRTVVPDLPGHGRPGWTVRAILDFTQQLPVR